MAKNRQKFLDIAKGIGLLLVIIGHLFQYGKLAFNTIFSFHMPLFFIISGMCFCFHKNENFKNFVLKK